MHDNNIPFQREYTQHSNAAATASYITNYISKLSLEECFKNYKRVKSLTVIKQE